MQWMGLNEIREKFLSFYESKDHLRMPSFPLVPQGDSSLLLINSGMAPLKPYFTGQIAPPKKRATTCQKCIRTPDIERVGKTSRHGTFFEMLGNFSFGDYFKNEATAWAWEFCTTVMELPVDRLYVSYYCEDIETYNIWKDKIGVDPSHLVPLGKEDNFWEIGSGPCGPCSEIYFDRGEQYGCGKPGCAVGCDCDRFVEFWNLVFTQFDSDGNGNYGKLAHPNIDTGMGLERLACIMQGVDNLFEVDTIKNVLEVAASYAGVKYGENDRTDTCLRVITDHIRSTTFLISDGVLPSNEGRGYVLRRLLRRAARNGKLLSIEGRFLAKLCDAVIAGSGEAYPELVEKKDYIKKIIDREEDLFDKTVNQGLSMLETSVAAMKENGERVLSGEAAFKLHDTFGFPIDLTEEILAEKELGVDREGFDKLMKQQKEMARAAREKLGDFAWSDSVLDTLDKSFKTKFVGYEDTAAGAKIFAIVSEGELVDGAQVGDKVTVILDATPFYAESGGQVGDSGRIFKNGGEIEVHDCKKTNDGKYMHIGVVKSGSFVTGDAVSAEISVGRRRAIMRNHSSAHLLQSALRRVLGSHVEQAGSYVDEHRMRFDFSHFSAMTKEELEEVERIVNENILAGCAVVIKEMPIKEAKQQGATALFGEKYGDIVRVVKMGDVSCELCGGTHVPDISRIGLFKIISESSVAAGVRRIEAVTGENVIALIDEKNEMLSDVAAKLKSSVNDVVKKAAQLAETSKEQVREIEALKTKIAGGKLGDLEAAIANNGGIEVLVASIEVDSPDELRTVCDSLKDKHPDIVCVIAGDAGDKVNLCAVCGKAAIEKGVRAGEIVSAAAKIAGGGGGGRPDSAMAGCKIREKVGEALKFAETRINEILN